MVQNESTPISKSKPANYRAVDMNAMLRLMRPLNGTAPDLIAGKRRLLADLCRFIGVKMGSLPPDSLAPRPEATVVGPLNAPVQHQAGLLPSTHRPPLVSNLPPRLEQTLQLLLRGDSEKQVARKLKISPHTVHDHVKRLYRRYGVSTRAELLAKHFQR